MLKLLTLEGFLSLSANTVRRIKKYLTGFGLNENEVYKFDDSEEFIDEICRCIEYGDTIVVASENEEFNYVKREVINALGLTSEKNPEIAELLKKTRKNGGGRIHDVDGHVLMPAQGDVYLSDDGLYSGFCVEFANAARIIFIPLDDTRLDLLFEYITNEFNNYPIQGYVPQSEEAKEEIPEKKQEEESPITEFEDISSHTDKEKKKENDSIFDGIDSGKQDDTFEEDFSKVIGGEKESKASKPFDVVHVSFTPSTVDGQVVYKQNIVEDDKEKKQKEEEEKWLEELRVEKVRREQEERKQEELRIQEEERRKREAEEEAKRLEELRIQEEERKRQEELRLKEEEAKRLEELRLQEEERQRRQAEEEAKIIEELRLQEEERKQKEAEEEAKRQEELRIKEEEARKQEELLRQEEEAKRQEELRIQEEERRRIEEQQWLQQLRQAEEERKRLEQEEAKRLEEEAEKQEQLRLMEEERKRAEAEEEAKRQEELRIQEEERKKREAEEEAKRREEEARKQEELRILEEERIRREEEEAKIQEQLRQEAIRKAEEERIRQEEERKRQEAIRQEQLRREEEERRRQEEEAKKQEAIRQELQRREEEEKRRQEEVRKQEQIRQEILRREEEERKRRQEEEHRQEELRKELQRREEEEKRRQEEAKKQEQLRQELQRREEEETKRQEEIRRQEQLLQDQIKREDEERRKKDEEEEARQEQFRQGQQESAFGSSSVFSGFENDGDDEDDRFSLKMRNGENYQVDDNADEADLTGFEDTLVAGAKASYALMQTDKTVTFVDGEFSAYLSSMAKKIDGLADTFTFCEAKIENEADLDVQVALAKKTRLALRDTGASYATALSPIIEEKRDGQPFYYAYIVIHDGNSAKAKKVSTTSKSGVESLIPHAFSVMFGLILQKADNLSDTQVEMMRDKELDKKKKLITLCACVGVALIAIVTAVIMVVNYFRAGPDVYTTTSPSNSIDQTVPTSGGVAGEPTTDPNYSYPGEPIATDVSGSTTTSIVPSQTGSFVFTVYGYGHGVGMSQNGANYYAGLGKSYLEILAMYYYGTTLVLGDTAPEVVTYGGNSYSLRNYLAIAVESEMGSSYHTEALKAQTVAIYTFAKYYGFNVPVTAHAFNKQPSQAVYEAVDLVAGQYLQYEGQVCQTFFHSISAGKTASYANTFGDSQIAYLSGGRPSYGDVNAENYSTTVTMTSDQLKTLVAQNTGIQLSGDPSTWLQIISHDACIDANTGYVAQIKVGDQTYTGNLFRTQVLGGGIRSHCFTVTYTPSY